MPCWPRRRPWSNRWSRSRNARSNSSPRSQDKRRSRSRTASSTARSSGCSMGLFGQAAVRAIEQRDPTTFGHSGRVANMTVSLAAVVDKAGDGPYSGLTFTREQLREIRYAGLLHDFGKVGVREQVLVKAKKLYPLQLELI